MISELAARIVVYFPLGKYEEKILFPSEVNIFIVIQVTQFESLSISK